MRFFNPLQDNWNEHFLARNGLIFGKSAVGRASASILFQPMPALAPNLDTPIHFHFAMSERLAVLTAALMQRHDAVNYRAARHALNEFNLAIATLDPTEREVAVFIGQWARAQMRFRAGSAPNVRQNLREGIANLRRGDLSAVGRDAELFRHEWVAMSAIQAATLGRLWNNREMERRARTLATRVYSDLATHPLLGSSHFLWRALVHKGELAAVDLPALDAYIDDVAEAEQANTFVLLGEMSEAVAKSESQVGVIESAFALVDKTMETAGYAAGGDRAESVTLRRRGWLLQLRLELPIDARLLRNDLSYWTNLGLTNEVRTLYADLRRWRYDVAQLEMDLDRKTLGTSLGPLAA